MSVGSETHFTVSTGCRVNSFTTRVAAPLINPFFNFKTAESSFEALVTDFPSSTVIEVSITATLTVLADRKIIVVLKATIAAPQILGGVR